MSLRKKMAIESESMGLAISDAEIEVLARELEKLIKEFSSDDPSIQLPGLAKVQVLISGLSRDSQAQGVKLHESRGKHAAVLESMFDEGPMPQAGELMGALIYATLHERHTVRSQRDLEAARQRASETGRPCCMLILIIAAVALGAALMGGN